ncbi:MAG: TlpA family protein disulfide reductase [Nannocystaceae bacterium]
MLFSTVAAAVCIASACGGDTPAPEKEFAARALTDEVEGAVVKGVATSPDGSPAFGLQVRLIDPYADPTHRNDRELASFTTAKDGRFELATEHAGFVWLEFKSLLGAPVRYNFFLEEGRKREPLHVSYTHENSSDSILGITPADSLSGKLAAANARDVKHMSKIVELIETHQSPDKATEFHRQTVAAFAAYADDIESEPDDVVRSANAVYFFFVHHNVTRMLPREMRAQTREQKLATWLLDTIEPTSPLWSVSFFSIASKVADTTGSPRRYDMRIESMIEHADPVVSAGALVHAAERRLASGDPEGAHAIVQRLNAPPWNGAQADQVTKMIERSAAERPVPEFSFPTLVDGAPPLRSSELAGKPYLLDLWATWCGPCIVERETLHSVYERHHEKAGLEIVSISLDRSAAVVEQFREEKWPMPWRHVLGKSEASEAHIAALFGKDKKLPRMILVDADGTIVAEADELTYDTVEEAVNIMTAK